MIHIKPEIEAAAKATSGTVGPNEAANNERLVALEKVQSIPRQLSPQHRARLTSAIQASVALRDQFDRQLNPQAMPISRPAVQGLAPSQLFLKGYRLSILNALATLKPIDRALVSSYKQTCLETQLDSLASNITKLQKITEENPGLTQQQNRAPIQQLYQFVVQRRDSLSDGLDKGVVEMAHQLNRMLSVKIENKEYNQVIECAKEIIESLVIAEYSLLRNACSKLPSIMKAISMVNKHAGYSHTCMRPSEFNRLDDHGNSLLSAAVLVVLTDAKGSSFRFHDKNQKVAENKPWYRDWAITEYRRGSEERSFIAENKENGSTSLINHYSVHPDAEGGYDYEETMLGLMSNLPAG